ncbi:helix-turn-helix domain-containing protein [Nonomuraea sp. NPDC049714]|uniref:helix-turn-helix domain-containing protein n=1 Tax=Nonomuraea sp. NPDC049714 TaxID=3364357 RepID=UPI00379775E7
MQEQSTGAMLAAARQSAGLTVEQLSANTRIREAIILAIERDDLSKFEGDFYIRGHVRALAKAVGLDPDEVVHLYDQQHGGAPAPVRAAAVFQADRTASLGERRGPSWTMALGVAVAVVVVFGVVRVMGGESDQVRTAGGHGTAAPSVPPNSPFTEEPRRSRPKAIAKEDLVVVKVKAKRASYLNVLDAKGKKMFAGTLQAGRSSTWRTASRMNLVISDGGAVSLQVNGKNLGPAGRSGEMVKRSFGPAKPRAR